MPWTLIAIVITNSWIKAPGWQRNTFKQALGAFWVPIGENLAPLFWDFRPHEKIKYKAQFGKCTLQSNKFKIYLNRTETSVIDNKFANLEAYLYCDSHIDSCRKVYLDFLKLTH